MPWVWRCSTHHLQGSPQHPTQEVGVNEGRVVIRKLHKVHQRVVFQDEGEFISSWAPVGDAWSDAQVHLERHLLGDTQLLGNGDNYAIRKGSEDKAVASESL